MRRVIIESPFAGDVVRNTRYLQACMRDCLLRGEAPFASHGLYIQAGVLRDDVPAERKHGIEAGFAWRQAADATVVYTDLGMSNGMKHGVVHAQDMAHPIEYRELGGEWKQRLRPKVFSKRHLVAFLYMLMRDAAPTSEVVRIVRMLDTSSQDDVVYTSKELQAYAERLAGELLDDDA